MTKQREEQNKENDFFDLPLKVILQNIASSILLTLNDITRGETYDSINSFLQVFLKENRILYLGIFIAIFAIFIFLFFG